ncbi:hypothetical protein H5410_031511, partial [Solanum commersonii]
MNIRNKTQITHEKINCALKDSICDTPIPEILMLAILATCASSSSTKRIRCNAHTKKKGTQCMFSPIGLPLFSDRSSARFTQDQKGLSTACNGDECK